MAQPQPPQFQPQQPQPQPQPQPSQPQQRFTPSPSQPGTLGPDQLQQQQPPIDPQTVEYLTYEDSEAKIRFDVPSHWQQIAPQPPDVVAFQNPQTFSVVAVRVTPVPQGTTLEQTVPMKVNALGSFFPNFQYIGGEPVTIDGKSGYNIMYSFSDPQGNPFIGTNAWTISKDVEYDFRYIAPSNQFYSEFLIANHMSATIDILDSWFE